MFREHRNALGEDKTRYVQIESVGFPSRDEMESIRNEWIEDLGEVPPGNGVESSMWISSVSWENAFVLLELTASRFFDE